MNDSPLPQSIDVATEAERHTAYHEAGHAVMAMWLGRDIHRVSILPNKTRLGQCELKKGARRASQDRLEDEVLILLAGAVAEGRLTGRYCWEGASSDLRQARVLTESRAGTARQAERLERRFLSKAESIIDDDACWLAIELIASDLLKRKTISGRAAKHHFQQAVK